MIRFLFKHNCVCVCVPVRGLMTAMSAESGTQEGISRHCISKAKPLETQDRVFLMRGGTGVCVCWCVWECVVFGLAAEYTYFVKKQPASYICCTSSRGEKVAINTHIPYDIIQSQMAFMHMSAPQRHVLRCSPSQRHTHCAARPLWQASMCLSVWHGVGRGARALCAMLHQRQPLHVHSTQRARGYRTHTPTYTFHPYIHPSPAISFPAMCVPHSLYLFCVRVCLCVCVRVGWLAMPSVPSAATPLLTSHPSHSSQGWA